MPHVAFQLQAATDAALTALMLQHGLLLLGEGAPRLAPGVLYSHIGDATLEGGSVKLAGRYAFVAIDEEVFGADEAASVLLALAPHRYDGPDIRYLLGGSNWQSVNGVPDSVDMAQARQALLNAGLLDKVEQAIQAIEDPLQRKAAVIDWEYRGRVRRRAELTLKLAALLKLTDKQVDDLFIAASNL